VQGEVDTSKAGKYTITYTNGGASQEVIVTVLESKEAIEAQDSTLYVGDSWDPVDNFVKATGKTGEDIPFDKSMVQGEVDTTKAGKYTITYTNGGASQEVTVTILNSNINVNEENQSNNNQQINKNESDRPSSTNQNEIPKFGERKHPYLSFLGIGFVLSIIAFKKKRILFKKD
ncbi:bacterial Ig-like domain-containing protein, partial [Enterococcus casseliflavus]|uniref:bacterial Ig-like domain-containing protein n=1 Tax=Enterococcus casseliflavus TaxID=37734 RepID=UPI0023310AEF